MLVPFVVEPMVLSGERHWAPRELQAHLNSFMRNWKQIGLLIHDGQNITGSKFWKALEQQFEGKVEWKTWKECMRNTPSLPGDLWTGDLQEAELEALATVARLCVTSPEKIEKITSGAPLELRSLSDFANADALIAAEKLSNSHINKGDSTGSIWKSRFEALATSSNSYIKNVSIVDPYTVERQLRGEHTELHRFLCYLGRSASSRKNVTVYSKWPYRGKSDGQKNKEIIDRMYALRKDTNLDRIGSLTLRLFHKDPPNDRFVAFGENYLWDLGHGLEPFVDEYALKDCSATFKTWDNAESYRKLLNDWRDDEFMIEIWKNRS